MPEQAPSDARKSLRMQSLDLLRFPLAVIVVAIHVIATRSYAIGGKLVRFDSMDGAKEFYLFFDAFLRSQSVPIYFFISGYVFFLGIRLTIDTYGHKLHNRTKSLLIPYISWNVIAIIVALLAFLPALRDFFPAAQGYSIVWSVQSVLGSFWNTKYGIFQDNVPSISGADIYPQDYPLWFVRDLMLIVISAPLIYFCLKRTRWYAVAALGAAWFLLSPFKTGHLGQLLVGFFFFTWGAHMSYHGRDMIADFNRFFKPCACVYMTVSLVLWLCAPLPSMVAALLKSVNVVAGMVMAYGLAARLIQSRRVKVSRFLAAASFFVYAGHGIFVGYLNVILFDLFRPTDFISVAAVYLATLVIVISSLLFVFKMSGRYLPKLQQLLAGRVFRS